MATSGSYDAIATGQVLTGATADVVIADHAASEARTADLDISLAEMDSALAVARAVGEVTFQEVDLVVKPASFGEYLTHRQRFEFALEACEDGGARDDIRQELADFQTANPEFYEKEFDRF